MPHLETHSPRGGTIDVPPTSASHTDPETGVTTELRVVPDLTSNTDTTPKEDPILMAEERLDRIKSALHWYTATQRLTLTPLHYPTVVAEGPHLPGACSCGLPYYLTETFALSKETDGSCQHAGKHPIHTGFASNPDVQATTPDEAYALWGDVPWNIGVVTGKSVGLVVFDVDVRADGLASMTSLTEALAIEAPDWEFSSTFSYFTSGQKNRGYHLFFRVSPDDAEAWRKLVRLGENILPGVELKWRRGIVVASPSLHASGQLYDLGNSVTILEMDALKVELLSRAIARSRGEAVPSTVSTSGTRPGFASLVERATGSTGTAFGGDLNWENVGSETRDNPGYWSRIIEHILHTGRTPVTFGPGDHNDTLRALIGAAAKICFAYPAYAESTRDTIRRHGNPDWIPAFYGSLCAEIDQLVTSPEPWQKTDPQNFLGLVRHAMRMELEKDGHRI